MGTVNSTRVSMKQGIGRRFALVTVVAALVGCGARDEEAAKSLQVIEPAAYWSVRGKVGDSNYIRPVVRFRLRNTGAEPVGYVQTMAVFRREKAPTESWGSAFEFSISGESVGPGASSHVITLRSDSNYFSKDEPERMFESKEWEQVSVEIFAKVKSSDWKSLTKLDVPKRIGAPGVETFTENAPSSR